MFQSSIRNKICIIIISVQQFYYRSFVPLPFERYYILTIIFIKRGLPVLAVFEPSTCLLLSGEDKLISTYTLNCFCLYQQPTWLDEINGTIYFVHSHELLSYMVLLWLWMSLTLLPAIRRAFRRRETGRKRRNIKEIEAERELWNRNADTPTGLSRSGVLDARSKRKHEHLYGILISSRRG